MSRLACLLVALALPCATAACSSDGSTDATPRGEITAAVGVTFGPNAVALGASRADLEAALGAPERTRDLGSAGLHFAYPERGVSGVFSAAGPDATVQALRLDPSAFSGAVAGLGEVDATLTPDAVTAAYGAPTHDPFSDVWWYRGRGIAFAWDGDTASRILLFAPTAP